MKDELTTRSCCPAEQATVVFGGKWRVGIVHHLQEGAKRFNQLRECMPGIIQKMLTQQLRHLQRYGIIQRNQLQRIPPHVEYSLTPLGKKMFPLLADITRWAELHMPAIHAAAAKFDAAKRRES
ncbi:MAG: helix-turn-helix transcriptional regulator [Pirellulales bacterium]|nr:helix-turn-helix transcriptional regulator [Pirellulales bacterium]